MTVNLPSPPLALNITSQPGGITILVHRARGQRHHRLRRVFLTGPEVETMQLEKENANHEPGPLVSVNKRMIADDAVRIDRGQAHDVPRLRVCVVLSWPGKSGLQEPTIAQSRRAPVKR